MGVGWGEDVGGQQEGSGIEADPAVANLRGIKGWAAGAFDDPESMTTLPGSEAFPTLSQVVVIGKHKAKRPFRRRKQQQGQTTTTNSSTPHSEHDVEGAEAEINEDQRICSEHLDNQEDVSPTVSLVLLLGLLLRPVIIFSAYLLGVVCWLFSVFFCWCFFFRAHMK